MYNQLEPRAKLALNQAFLSNVKCGRNFQTFQNALDVFANQDTERLRAKKAIESIFPVNKFILNNINRVSNVKKSLVKAKVHRNLTN